MPDLIWIILVFIFILIGFIGSVLPALPGIPIAFTGLLIYKLCPLGETLSWWWISFCAILTLLGMVINYFMPIFTVKQFGGSKYGAIGATIGIFVGFILPYGFLYGPFLGALIGELIYDFMDKKGALKASLGALLGYILCMGVNIIICGITMTIFIIHLTFTYFSNN
ncbi:MAG: DUF456 domain-containing protein [Apibacter sp.]|jgi:uncharacterized protein|nr:DUF456 domain-containing protein [Apibacter sp.]